MLLQSSCGDDQPVPRFVIQGETFVDVPGSLNAIETHSLIVREVDPLINSLLDINGMTAEQVSEILPGTALIRARSQNVDLSFINEISIRAISRIDPARSIEMFYMDEVRFNEDFEMPLLPSIADVKSILLEGKFDLEVRLQLRRFSPASFRMELLYELDAFSNL